MPRYHFSSVDGGRDWDPEGVDLPDQHAARAYAVRYAGELLQSEPEAVWDAGQWRVEVSDDAGTLLFTVTTTGAYGPGSAAG